MSQYCFVLDLKSAKSRCLVLTDGKFQQDITFYVSKSNIDVSIPSISNQPVNFLGKTISFTVSDKDQMEVISSAVSKGLAFINKSFYRGVQQSLDSSTFTCASVVPALAHLSDSYISSFTFRTKVSCYILYLSVLPCLLSTKSLTSVMKSAKVPFTSSQIV